MSLWIEGYIGPNSNGPWPGPVDHGYRGSSGPRVQWSGCYLIQGSRFRWSGISRIPGSPRVWIERSNGPVDHGSSGPRVQWSGSRDGASSGPEFQVSQGCLGRGPSVHWTSGPRV
jgi:hypothetical protein